MDLGNQPSCNILMTLWITWCDTTCFPCLKHAIYHQCLVSNIARHRFEYVIKRLLHIPHKNQPESIINSLRLIILTLAVNCGLTTKCWSILGWYFMVCSRYFCMSCCTFKGLCYSVCCCRFCILLLQVLYRLYGISWL